MWIIQAYTAKIFYKCIFRIQHLLDKFPYAGVYHVFKRHCISYERQIHAMGANRQVKNTAHAAVKRRSHPDDAPVSEIPGLTAVQVCAFCKEYSLPHRAWHCCKITQQCVCPAEEIATLSIYLLVLPEIAR